MSYIIFYFLNITDESNQIIHEYLKKLWIFRISRIFQIKTNNKCGYSLGTKRITDIVDFPDICFVPRPNIVVVRWVYVD